MAERKTGNEQRLGIIVMLVIASSLVFFGIAAAAETPIFIYVGLVLFVLGVIPVWFILVGFSRRWTDLETRIDELESRKQHRD